jgi:hypothetical protein
MNAGLQVLGVALPWVFFGGLAVHFRRLERRTEALEKLLRGDTSPGGPYRQMEPRPPAPPEFVDAYAMPNTHTIEKQNDERKALKAKYEKIAEESMIAQEAFENVQKHRKS